LKWGTPVPKQGYERKVFYVWFDAPIGYISITGNYSPDWKQWWKNPENVKLYQFMGKDNVPFHTVIFPSTLIGTNEPWTLLHHLSTTEYLQYENGKFSKSRGIGVFGNDVAKTKIPVEVWRYYLISMRPEGQDSEFTWNGLAVANNNELLTNLGNFVNRIVKFVKTKYDGVIPESVPNDQEARLISNVNARLSKYIESLEVTKLRAGLKLFMEISTLGNQYLQDNKLSNSLFSDEKVRCDTVVNTAINLVYLLSALVYPYMPTTAAQILEQLKAPLRKITNVWEANDIKCGHEIGEPSYLFQAISESKIEEMRKTFAGKQAVVSPKKEVNLKSEPINSKVSQELSEKITEQGNLVRKLKTEKAPADEIKKQVEVLLQLKSQLTKAS
jgi:methionyl-tRNA synthetase